MNKNSSDTLWVISVLIVVSVIFYMIFGIEARLREHDKQISKIADVITLLATNQLVMVEALKKL